jgi:hypothetical protein
VIAGPPAKSERLPAVIEDPAAATAEPGRVSEELALVIEERVAVIAGPPAKGERLLAVIEDPAAAEPARVSE